MANNSAEILLKLMLDKQSQREFDRGIQKAEDAIDDFTDALDKNEAAARANEAAQEGFRRGLDATKSKLEEVNQVSEKLASVSTTLFTTGAAITGAITASAKLYVDTMSAAGVEGEETAMRWVKSQDRIKASLVDVGRISAQAILPTLEKAADIAEKAADFVEENPDLVKTALKIGTVTALIGGIGLLAAKGIKFVADLKFLAAMTQYSVTTAAFSASVNRYATATGAGAITGRGGGLIGAGGVAATGGTGAIAVTGGLIAGLAAGGIALGLVGYDLIAKAYGLDDVKTILQKLAFIYKFRFNEFKSSLADLGAAIKKNSSSLVETAKADIKLYLEQRAKLVEVTMNYLSEEIRVRADMARKAISNIRDYTSRLWQSISAFFQNMGSSIVSFVQNIIGGVKGLLSGDASIPGRAMGGYASNGLYTLGEAGREFVMSNQTTRAAERAIGGQLTQASLLRAVGSRSVRYNDNRRFDSSLSPADRRMIREDTANVLQGALA